MPLLGKKLAQAFTTVLSVLGNCIELVVAGRSEYRLTLSEFEQADIINNTVQAKEALAQVRQDLLSLFAISLDRPVIIQIGQPRTLDWKMSATKEYNHVGNYTPRWFNSEMTHGITIVPGLKREKFKAVLAHELVHAYQSERNLTFSNSGLKEGMSRWVEYHLLRLYGLESEAAKLLKLQRYILGKSVVSILEYENKQGRQATLEWLTGGASAQ